MCHSNVKLCLSAGHRRWWRRAGPGASGCCRCCWLWLESSAAVKRINPDWVGLLGSAACCWSSLQPLWLFISFTLATALSSCGWCLIAKQHMVPSASDHSTTCLSNCTSQPPPQPPASPCSWEEYMLTDRSVGHACPNRLSSGGFLT